ncbi:DUF6069 family protein [Micromonospora maritima]|uniref:DUF6069 family protein n=1 Tax=Micromonospora maritima TaxID=986711 RepID=A0ABW7ZIV1_9ACTN
MSSAIGEARPALGRRATRAVVVVAAVVAAVVVFAVADAVVGEIRVPQRPASSETEPLTLSAVTFAAALACLAGWALLAVLERFTAPARARAVWTGVALVVFLLSLPYLPGFRLADRVAVALVHAALAAVLVPGLRRTVRAA